MQASAVPTAPEAPIALFDLDGTLALIGHRLHFIERRPKDWDAFFAACVDDRPNAPVIEVAAALAAQGLQVWIATGRSDAVRRPTQDWLARHAVPHARLLMRRDGDRRPDWVLKRGWLDSGLIPAARVRMVFEDRAQVVRMWRDAGLTCLQVADAD